jgi:hypothetical protein
MADTHTLEVPGARLHYEVRGSGPLLLVLGSPMAAAMFAPLADALADDHTVVTTDPRGIGSSPLADPDQDSTPDLRADDMAAVVDALGADSADVFGRRGPVLHPRAAPGHPLAARRRRAGRPEPGRGRDRRGLRRPDHVPDERGALRAAR